MKNKGQKTESRKDSDAPKLTVAFFIFMEEFRNTFKLNFPGEKSVSAVSLESNPSFICLVFTNGQKLLYSS
ncbi:hypothetical protein M0R45_018976 [Rubus argutus]|uniref:Uncharacterized protein n=1 Tax=Rubus argutus TaxID=59490 RepID=A0AAW1X6N0_RUBAR